MSYVPAWRRIGLKLEQESAANGVRTPVPVEPRITSKKRRAPDEITTPDETTTPGRSRLESDAAIRVPTKKRRLNPKPAASAKRLSPNLQINNAPTSTLNGGQHIEKQPNGPTNGKKAAPSKRKSVSFTQDTKAEDSDEAIRAQVPKADKTKSKTPSTTKPEKLEKRKLRREKPVSGDTDQEASAARSPKPYITYLSQYHSARDKWKFNKAHQNQLLKYIFDIHRVPTSFDQAVSNYLVGLQGEGARQRLREDAVQVLAEFQPEAGAPSDTQEANEMESAEERQRFKDEAQREDTGKVKQAINEGFVKSDAVVRDKQYPALLAKRKRAEMVLEALQQNSGLQSNPLPRPASTRPAPARPASTRPASTRTAFPEALKSTSTDEDASKSGPKKRSRPRKRRRLVTGVPDDDVDSSSDPPSNSSSESSSEEESEGEASAGSSMTGSGDSDTSEGSAGGNRSSDDNLTS